MRNVSSGGGWPAIRYAWRMARKAGGIVKFYKALRSKNACKTCALGMGGQRGGMVNEAGRFPEVCKKAMQAMAADMQPGIPDAFFAHTSVLQMQQMSPRELEASGRLTTPMMVRRGDDHYRPISWDDARARIAAKLNSLSPNQTFWYFSGRSSNEAGFLLQLFARMYGTNNVNNCSYYCHQASGVGLASVTGSGTATLLMEDLEKADLVFVIGGNPASNHPRLMTSLKNIRRQGGKVIVINPVVETGLVNFRVPSDVRSLLFGTKIATQYVQPHIGGDLALLHGIAKRIDEMGAIDQAMLDQHCEGWPALAEHLRGVSWSEICSKSGVSKHEIDQIAETYSAAKNVVFSWTMGITHHAHGVQNVQMIAALALMRGMVGRRSAGLMPIRGHSNVQGIGSIGAVPKLKEAFFDRLQSHYGVELPTTPGLDTLGCMESAYDRQLKAGFCLGGNLYGSNPDSTYAAKAMTNLELLVYLNTSLNTGHAHGLAEETLILPVLARDEDPQRTTQESMFNLVRLSDGGPRRHVGPRTEVEVIAGLASDVIGNEGPVDWSSLASTGNIRQVIGAVVPGFEKISQIDRTREEFQIDGRTFHEPRFATPDGR
ncbi:MAG TPA: FdhF/YdeP family oxidoreductase, partial [Pirellulales bacterium]|nr:FdhF/YdeP family oxidoreductase [Pirellulales bacterium]